MIYVDQIYYANMWFIWTSPGNENNIQAVKP